MGSMTIFIVVLRSIHRKKLPIIRFKAKETKNSQIFFEAQKIARVLKAKKNWQSTWCFMRMDMFKKGHSITRSRGISIGQNLISDHF